MSESRDTPLDLTGTADDRIAQLTQLDAGDLSADWLRRQLDAALQAWAGDETTLDIDEEARVDY
ncbi:hypothetical protein [Microbacterium sp. P04]|uniref:hypothetical protein n=1 Tax=Microbacterium sp. P04 TaxID=3366947 RepID=UPI003746ECB4